MNKLYLFFTILLQVIIICLTCLKWSLMIPNIVIYLSKKSISRLQRILFYKIYKEKKNKNSQAKVEPPSEHKEAEETNILKNETASPVGLSKTTFITELPKLKSTEPFQSIPLEKEYVIESTEEPEIDPNDIHVQESGENIEEMLLNEDPDMFSHDGDLPSDLSSGVTIEQLRMTYNTLKQNDPHIEEENTVTEVLQMLEGSEFFNFFLLQAECSFKAKQLMEEMENHDSESSFDEDKYI